MDKISAAALAAALFFSFQSAVAEPLDSLGRKHLHDNAPAGNSGSGIVGVSVPGKFHLSFGGQVKAVAVADFGHPISSPDMFTTSEIPMGPTNGNGSEFKISARQTSLYLNAVALPESSNRVGAYISFNLVDQNYIPQLVYAYLRWRGVQAGYDYTLFSDPLATPGGIDYEGVNSLLATGVAGLRWTGKFGIDRRWSVAVGLESPRLSLTEASLNGKIIAGKVSQRLPDIPVALTYSWAEGAHVRLAGMFRNLYTRNFLSEKNIDYVGWGIHLSAVVNPVAPLTCYAAGWYGRGISNICQDLNGIGLDLVPTTDGRGLTPLKAWGSYVGIQYNFCNNWSVIATYSHIRTYPQRYAGGSTSRESQYHWAQYASGTLNYSFNKYLGAAIEYIWGRRANCNGTRAADTRLQAALTLTL
ncbi:MAG: hypothetical protein NC097_04625 [Clostridium sp.]|nr:hypothetical protein [Prevotella sp.]MCM1429062.1 hypothetical protein [Clostridium sp.]MCM1475407.1 hypothetical protein [Muribaculaceae bacterium]